jgi:hypothetical protein
MCLLTAPPAGILGFLYGSVGGFWLSVRAKRCRSLIHIVIESAALGTLLSLLFPVFHWALRLGPEGAGLEAKGFIFSVGVGCPTAILLALYCGPMLLAHDAGGRREA